MEHLTVDRGVIVEPRHLRLVPDHTDQRDEHPFAVIACLIGLAVYVGVILWAVL